MSYRLDQDSLTLIFKQIKENVVLPESGKGLSTNDYTTAEKTKLAGIATSAQVNKIETVKVNGTALTISSKAVDITVPTKTSALTNDSGFITTADIPEGAAASTTTPKMNGTAAVGTELAFARGDHVHPSDTTRVPTSRTINGKALTGNITLTASDVGAATASDVATAKQEAIDTILGGAVDADFDTLKEVAAWIQSDTTSSAELVTRVTTIENNYVSESDITSLTTTEVETAWSNA